MRGPKTGNPVDMAATGVGALCGISPHSGYLGGFVLRVESSKESEA